MNVCVEITPELLYAKNMSYSGPRRIEYGSPIPIINAKKEPISSFATIFATFAILPKMLSKQFYLEV